MITAIASVVVLTTIMISLVGVVALAARLLKDKE